MAFRMSDERYTLRVGAGAIEKNLIASFTTRNAIFIYYPMKHVYVYYYARLSDRISSVILRRVEQHDDTITKIKGFHRITRIQRVVVCNINRTADLAKTLFLKTPGSKIAWAKKDFAWQAGGFL